MHRLVAWNRELQAAHGRMRDALQVARASVDAASAAPVDHAAMRRDLLLYCHGFCIALSGHHAGEDRELFPELAARYPRLRPTIAKLAQDHSMIAHLLTQFDHVIQASPPASPGELSSHLDGLSAIMESHFRFEERELLEVLATLEWDVDPGGVLGPL